ncbi:hypothetical protein TVAG_315650 [Trichomonas vaginalis G3]|uniref:Uncharacterized protein n=1 Tax=Trichomonas vaginalis (strain ATCC PRA-98 / G3) TaxID=412133 RepID=A2GA24_TRIV3|nr:hypothetical protein TVAGG3_0734040 [Trichomonas vaginalis G3]EAX85994.1 hypothetical protein TVAG_315650 [Trichomonas vaginalis G3]KAI5511454.1 hypothetical protein TVAGG3_0734040 [Trichomonas vaginalis G3]|eukprot:XP_001298924.1 hypothetical protein [Trichomonas vaginalis G3]
MNIDQSITQDENHLLIMISVDVAAHFLICSKDPCAIAKQFYDKYLISKDEYRYCIREALVNKYKQLLYDKTPYTKKSELIKPFKQALVLIICKHLKVLTYQSDKHVYIVDDFDSKLAWSWCYILEIISADYCFFNDKEQEKKIGRVLCKVYEYARLKVQKIQSQKLEEINLDEFTKFLGSDLLMLLN